MIEATADVVAATDAVVNAIAVPPLEIVVHRLAIAALRLEIKMKAVHGKAHGIFAVDPPAAQRVPVQARAVAAPKNRPAR